MHRDPVRAEQRDGMTPERWLKVNVGRVCVSEENEKS
jgi:hypothetical protein